MRYSNRIRVFDLEATGFDPQANRVIEIAAFDVCLPELDIVPVNTFVVNPGRAIRAEASASIALLCRCDTIKASIRASSPMAKQPISWRGVKTEMAQGILGQGQTYSQSPVGYFVGIRQTSSNTRKRLRERQQWPAALPDMPRLGREVH